MATKTDGKVQELFQIVQKKKLDLEETIKTEKRSFITNCSFGWDENNISGRINIQTVSDPKVLVKALARLEEASAYEEKAAEKLGVENHKFEWLNYSLKDWTTDFQTRMAKIQSSKKKTELNKLEEKLNSLVSPELRAEMELEAIEKMLRD